MSLEVFDDPELDRALASGLSALAPEVEAVDLTLAELRPRFHRARTRRRVVRAGAGIAALLVVGSIALAESPSVRRSHVTVESPARRPETTAPKRTSTTARHHKVVATPRTTVPTTKPTIPAAGPSPSHVSVSPTTPPAFAPPPPTPAPTVPRTTPSTSPVAKPVVNAHWYSSSAGSIFVRLDHDRMVLLKVLPHAGFHGRINAEMRSYISVSFRRNGTTVSRVVLTLRDHHIVQAPGDGTASVGSGTSHASSASGHHRHHNGGTETKVSPPSPGSQGAPVADTPSNPENPDNPDNTIAHAPNDDTNG